MTGAPEPISETGRTALERELAELRTERDAVAAAVRGGDEEVGDRADQADELQRADQLDRLDDRITVVEARLREAAAAGAPSTESVGVGSTVTLRFADADEMTVRIGELAEELDPELVTADSPLGRVLLGRRAGETVEYEAPGGRTTALVLSIGGGEAA
ncbi:GreA/GreB family elongation factor [Kitasatospora putterlickiae]|uniref:GreA/GreB family elongation factor n=1 Tax=Kitasatospora putterlickiae TaxID=221725 RepID=A0ABN1YHA0_9ACTN